MPDGLGMDEAAERLGISREAVRKRLKREKLKGKKINGRWYIDLPDTADRPADTGADNGPDHRTDERTESGQHGNMVAQHDRCDATIAILQEENKRVWEENEKLWREIEARRGAERELRIVILNLSQRIPALDARESSQNEPQAAMHMYRVPEPPQRSWWQFWRRS